MTFFIPWNNERINTGRRPQRFFLPKREHPLKGSCLNTAAKPFFSLTNPGGTVRSFLNALEAGKEEEAMGYICASALPMVDMDMLKELFQGKKGLFFFCADGTMNMPTVTLACGGEDKTEIIALKMIAEPDDISEWKICCIERE